MGCFRAPQPWQKTAPLKRPIKRSMISGTKIASQNRSDHGGRKRVRDHSAAEIAGFFASPAANKLLAASDFGVSLKIAGSSQRPQLQVAAAARFRGRSDHGRLSSKPSFLSAARKGQHATRIRTRRIWATAARRRSYRSLFHHNSCHFFLYKKGHSVLKTFRICKQYFWMGGSSFCKGWQGGVLQKGALLSWLHEGARWVGASDTTSGSGSVLSDFSIKKGTEEAMKQ